jgi:formate hydrogenlyase subunit 6/NADH:ubiquinone oxidoreductase subunit I
MKINNNCIGCGICFEECAVNAIEATKNYQYKINLEKCIECGHCKDVCDNGAVEK